MECEISFLKKIFTLGVDTRSWPGRFSKVLRFKGFRIARPGSRPGGWGPCAGRSFFGFFDLPTCVPSDPVYPVVMCNTITNGNSPSLPCSACDFTGSYRDWTHLLGDLAHDREAYASLCDEHREAVDEEVREQRAMWDWSPGGLGWAEDIAPNEFPHPEFDDAEAPNQFPDHPDGDWEGDDTGD